MVLQTVIKQVDWTEQIVEGSLQIVHIVATSSTLLTSFYDTLPLPTIFYNCLLFGHCLLQFGLVVVAFSFCEREVQSMASLLSHCSIFFIQEHMRFSFHGCSLQLFFEGQVENLHAFCISFMWIWNASSSKKNLKMCIRFDKLHLLRHVFKVLYKCPNLAHSTY